MFPSGYFIECNNDNSTLNLSPLCANVCVCVSICAVCVRQSRFKRQFVFILTASIDDIIIFGDKQTHITYTHTFGDSFLMCNKNGTHKRQQILSERKNLFVLHKSYIIYFGYTLSCRREWTCRTVMGSETYTRHTTTTTRQ